MPGTVEGTGQLKKRTYCTLFDRNYALKGLALYRSLERHEANFELVILCMDDVIADALSALGLRHARLIRLREFETDELLAVKPERTIAEYCWTCTAPLVRHCLDVDADVDEVTYLDADLCFFSSPQPIHDEMGVSEIMIIGHRFPKRLDYLNRFGRFNVSWTTFRRGGQGQACLEEWRRDTLAWCFRRLEDDKFGDQKYLDAWPGKYAGAVAVIANVGAGVAPWNFEQYQIRIDALGRLTVDAQPLIFYHFHQFSLHHVGYTPFQQSLGDTRQPPRDIYRRYEDLLRDAHRELSAVHDGFVFGIHPRSWVRSVGGSVRSVGTVLRRVFRHFR